MNAKIPQDIGETKNQPHPSPPLLRTGAVKGKTIQFLISILFCLLLFSAVRNPSALYAHDTHTVSREILASIGFDQRLDSQVPPELEFRNEAGQPVKLSDFFGAKPVILSLGYLQCPNLCTLERSALEQSLQQIDFDAGTEFEVLIVSIDPIETAAQATTVKQQLLADYNRPGTETGWHLLTGEHDAIDRLADAVGFRYAYDAEQQQFAHASGLVVLTPRGRVARYLYGLEYAPRDLRLALVEAADNQIGSPVDQLLLFCYHYDPTTGKYSPLIMNLMRLAGLITVTGVGLMILILNRHGGPYDDPSQRTESEGMA